LRACVFEHFSAAISEVTLSPNRSIDEFENLYAELKLVAHRQVSQHRAQNTINTTALVHEAYLRLAQSDSAPSDRAHLVQLVALAMRQVLIDAARARGSHKRGAGALHIELTGANEVIGAQDPIELLAFDEALAQLSRDHPRMGKALELSFYGGVEAAEIAELNGVTLRTAQRDLLAARTIVLSKLQNSIEVKHDRAK
jgi:RNA polymerase sigma factor (TIGR02999 family)